MPGASPVVAVMGRGVVAPDDPIITADDLGLTRGDGCFDSARVVSSEGGPRVVDLDAHLDRLARSADTLGIPDPGAEAWRALVAEALAQWSGDGSLKLVLTRGREWDRAAGPTPFVVITPRRTGGADHGEPRSAVTLTRGHPSDAFVDAPWLLGGVKTLSYVVNVAAQREADRRGADDVIFTTTDGYALDAPTAGLLVVRDGRWLSTPVVGTGILESVSVATILAAAATDGHETAYELVPVDDLTRCDGVWLVASSRGPTPIGRIDGQPISVDRDLVAMARRYAGF